MVFDFEKNDFPISVDFIGWKTLKATKVGRQILSARESHKNKAFWLVFKFSLKKAIKKSNPSDNRAQKSYTVFEYFFFVAIKTWTEMKSEAKLDQKLVCTSRTVISLYS